MAKAFARYLPEFATGNAKPYDFGEHVKPLDTPIEKAKPADPLVEAEQRGRSAGLAEARAEHDKARKADLAAFEAKLAGERKAWVETEAKQLAEALATGFAGLEASLADKVALALTPIVGEALRQRAVDELSRTVAALLSGEAHATLEVHAPADVLESLGQQLTGAAAAVRLVPAPGPDVRVLADETVIETRIGAWGEQLGIAINGTRTGAGDV